MIRDVPIRSITVEPTHRCRRRCTFCYLGGRRGAADDRHGRELTAADLAARVSRLVAETGCRRVQLSGGEPLLREDLLDLVDGLRDVSVSMITDGAGLDEETVAALASRGVGPIQPTLLAATAPLHDEMRGAGSFRAITRGIARATAAGIPVVVSMVVTRRNWAEAAGVAEVAFALGARSFAVARYCPVGATKEIRDALMPTADQVAAAYGAALPYCRAIGLKLASVITVPRCVWPDPGKPPVETGVCSLVGPSTTVTVGPDGGVRTCGMSDDVAGVLGEEPWPAIAERIWTDLLAPLRDARVRPSICIGCPYFEECLGGCRLSARDVSLHEMAQDPLARGLRRDADR